jgi:hypothetical protein
MNDGKENCNHCAPRMPPEWYRMDPSAVHDGNCRGEKEEQEGDYPQVENQRFAENGGISDVLEHDSLHNSDSTFHKRMDHAVIVKSTSAIEPLAEGLA